MERPSIGRIWVEIGRPRATQFNCFQTTSVQYGGRVAIHKGLVMNFRCSPRRKHLQMSGKVNAQDLAVIIGVLVKHFQNGFFEGLAAVALTHGQN